MTWTAITTQNPGDGWTTTKVNQWVKGNIEHLAGMTIHGTALSALSGGSELLGNVSRWVYTETRGSNGDFATIPLDDQTGYATATGFELEFMIRSTYATGVAGDSATLEVNGDVGANYYSQREGAQDGGAIVNEDASGFAFLTSNANSPANSFAIGTIECRNFKNTASRKIFRVRSDVWYDTTATRTDKTALFWNNTAAITDIFINLTNGTPITGSLVRVRFIF